MKCTTVNIQAENEQGFIVINESDFNEDIHELFNTEDTNTKSERDLLKEEATTLGIEFESNIRSSKLKKLIAEKTK